MGYFQHFSINAVIYPIYIQWELNTVPKIHATVIAVWISLIWVDRHHERQKTTWPPLGCCERVTYIGFLSLFITNTWILWDKNVLFRHINSPTPEIKELTETIFHLGFNRGSHINKTGIEGSNICGAVSSSSWNGLHCWFLEIMIFIFRSIGSNHLWNLIWTSVPYYCFSPPQRGVSFINPSLAHPQLFHISENILVYKFHLLNILQYLCLYSSFISSTSWYFCDRILQFFAYNHGL